MRKKIAIYGKSEHLILIKEYINGKKIKPPNEISNWENNDGKGNKPIGIKVSKGLQDIKGGMVKIT